MHKKQIAREKRELTGERKKIDSLKPYPKKYKKAENILDKQDREVKKDSKLIRKIKAR